MNNDFTDQLTRLQALYSEQDYTIQLLDDVVGRQDQLITRLLADVELLKKQIQLLKTQMPETSDNGFELPPHY